MGAKRKISSVQLMEAPFSQLSGKEQDFGFVKIRFKRMKLLESNQKHFKWHIYGNGENCTAAYVIYF